MYIFGATAAVKIDEEDIDKVICLQWHITTGGYVESTSGIRLLHRLIMNAKEGEEVDHINGNKLDNRKENLRLCTREQNSHNI